MRFDRYLDHAELTAALHGLAREHPELCRVEEVGRSYEGREIWLAEITNTATGPADLKPAFWVDGNTHAGEVTGSMAALYLIHRLLTGYSSDPGMRRLLDAQAFYVLPRLSPDGAERYLKTPHTLRATLRPWPEPEEEPGLHPEDVDGDGEILHMRVEDEHGEWKVSETDPRLMVRRRPDETGGTYYRLYREGTFRDYDGFERRIARPLHGLDMNRQYPYRWQGEHEQPGAGPYPLSEPESRAHVEALLRRRNVFGIHTYHTFCGAILRPYSDRDDLEMPDHDLAVYRALGDRGTELTGYPNLSVYHGFRYDPRKTISGAFDDWAYDAYGVFAFTIELWSVARAAGVKVEDFIGFFRDPPEEALLRILAWNDRELDGEGFERWRPFDHPQLGRVEIGGWRTKFTFQNPPPHLLEAECERAFRFALAHARTAPLLDGRLSAKTLPGGLRRLELIVENTGYLPTSVTRVAEERKLAKPPEARLELPEGAELVSGERVVELGHLAGRSALEGSSWKSPAFFDGLPSAYARRVVWVVRGEGPVEVEVKSERAGTLRLRA
ncbi:M14 family zinc carboxypeptidase [Rubrobacter xylanophilus]|uniref:M14 family zinc carboxypeptidase n=1 Tax=Rubrobacter xylanophilus TaxID=49319 RepID=UPI001179C2D5